VSKPRLALRTAGVAALIVVAAVLPSFISDYHALEWATVGTYFIALLGLNVLTGYSGQISLGHGAFMAVGGYTSAILMAHHGVRDLWTIPLAGLVAGGAGLLFGLPALRLSGLYLALATFAVAVAFPALVKKFEHFTGGSMGLILNLPKAPGGLHLSSNDWLYYLTWAIGFTLLGLGALVSHSRIGRSFRAIRDSEVAAASSGVSPAFYKTLAFGISAFYAGIGGSLVAIETAYVNPQTFPITLSLFLVLGVAVGGLGSLVGCIFGAALIEFLPTVAPDVAGHAPSVIRDQVTPSVIQGLILVLVMLILPGGVAGLARLLENRALGPRFER
jgi:branched-chain amino acid transport system permease protein